MNIWIELTTVFIELFLFRYFFSGMLGRSDRPRSAQLATGAAYGALLAALSLLFPASLLRSTAIMLLTYFAAKIYFNKGWLSTFYPTILFFLFAILADILCGILLQSEGFSANELMGDGFDRLIYNIFGKLLHLLCLYVTLTVTKPGIDVGGILKALPLLSCQILSIYMCQQNFLIVMRGSGGGFLRFETLGILYINLVICAFIEALNRSHAREREAENARRQLELQENYYLDVMKRQEETRALWHDIKKYMASMEALVANENRGEAQKCFEQIKATFSGAAPIVDTGNRIIDSILTYGIKRAREVSVKIRTDIWIDSDIQFPATDLFVIIGNTLDNAIEAACQLEDKAARVVSVGLYQKNHILLYEVSNPYKEKERQKHGKVHGYGLKNVEACLARNQGSMNISKERGLFKVSAQINLE